MQIKSLLKNLSVAAVAFLVTVGVAHAALAVAPGAAAQLPITTGICGLVTQMGSVFKILRTLAFVGAAFCIASWAWGFISGGKAEMKDVQAKGIALIVGFSLLFLVGILLSYLMGSNGMCAAEINHAF